MNDDVAQAEAWPVLPPVQTDGGLALGHQPHMTQERTAPAIEAHLDKEKVNWIVKSGWKGLCPRCGKGRMFKGWLKITDKCGNCGLDYRFATPDDGPAFFSLCIIALPLIAAVVWLEIAFEPPYWVHLVTSAPFMALGTLLPLRPIKGWLVASQYVNRAQEAGTQGLWSALHGTEKGTNDFDQ